MRALLGIAPCLLAPASFLNAQTTDASTTAPAPGEEIILLDKMTVENSEDPNYILPTQPIEGAVGFAKPIVETPRSVSVVSSEMLSSMAIAEVADLSRIVPNANTTTHWGVQGNIDTRNMTADTYFRSMKRIELQGNSRTVLQANDQIEVVRGPAPTYLGSGKIGDYANMTPQVRSLPRRRLPRQALRLRRDNDRCQRQASRELRLRRPSPRGQIRAPRRLLPLRSRGAFGFLLHERSR